MPAPAAVTGDVAEAAAAAATADPVVEGEGGGEGDEKKEKVTWQKEAKCFASRVWPGCIGDGTMKCLCKNVMGSVLLFQKKFPRVGGDLVQQIERAPK